MGPTGAGTVRSRVFQQLNIAHLSSVYQSFHQLENLHGQSTLNQYCAHQ